MIKIDGSIGEGGGQILRTSIALSTATGRDVEVFNIRAKRPRPGLRPQHLWAIKSVAEICDADVEGLKEHSMRVVFRPKEIVNRSLKIDIGTAGSIMLLLQAIIPSIANSGTHLDLEVRGGTDVKWSPNGDYFHHLVVPLYSLLGLNVKFEIRRRGYYPLGGGLVFCSIDAPRSIRSIDLSEREQSNVRISSVCSNLSQEVAERQAKSAVNDLNAVGIEASNVDVRSEDAPSPGTAICVYNLDEKRSYVGSDALGEKRKPAEIVGSDVVSRFLIGYESTAALDHNLADMIIPLICLSREPSRFTTSKISEHLVTNLTVANEITGCTHKIKRIKKNLFEVRLKP